MKKTLIPEGTPLFENIARNQIPEILESLSAVQKDYHKNEGILRQGDSVSDLGILLSGSAHSLKTDITGNRDPAEARQLYRRTSGRQPGKEKSGNRTGRRSLFRPVPSLSEAAHSKQLPRTRPSPL